MLDNDSRISACSSQTRNDIYFSVKTKSSSVLAFIFQVIKVFVVDTNLRCSTLAVAQTYSDIRLPYLWHPIQKPWRQSQSGTVHREAQVSKASGPPTYLHNLHHSQLLALRPKHKNLAQSSAANYEHTYQGLLMWMERTRTSRALNFPPASGPYPEVQEAISPRFHALLALSMLATIRMGNSMEFPVRDVWMACETR